MLRRAATTALRLSAAGALVATLSACGHDRDTTTTGLDRSATDNKGRAGADQNASTPSTIAVAQGPVILRQMPPPWGVPPPGEEAKAISAAGLPFLHAAGQVQHTHTHLDIILDGKRIDVPAQIGFDLGVQVQSPILTRDGSGVIHVESPTVRTFTLGEFFTEWEVRLSSSCIASTCTSQTEAVKFYVDGAPFTGNPNEIVLRSHQEIAIIAAPVGTEPDVPSLYNFPNGY